MSEEGVPNYLENGLIEKLGRDNVIVTSSSLARGVVSDFINRDKAFCWTKNEPYAWFAVDFGTKSISPTHYTLRYGSSGNNVCPRNWLLQATNEESALKSKKPPHEDPNWVTLRKHENDSHIDTDFGVYTWPLPKSEKSYRFFRIIQTGKNKMPNNADWGDTLVTSGFEIYGIIPSLSSNFKLKNCEYKEDGDLNGVIHHLEYDVVVESSSIWRGQVNDFISKDKVFVWTKNEPNSWVAVDLKEGRSLSPTHYTMKYGSSGNNVPPRNWLLQATNDESALNSTISDDLRWVTLYTHVNDSSIDTEFGLKTWRLQPSDKTKFYRIFRILQTGKNKMPDNAEWGDTLVISGFELYGTLKTTRSLDEKDEEDIKDTIPYLQSIYAYTSDDGNGIISNLGGDRANVDVQSSSIWRGQVRDFISKGKVFVWTKNEPFSWVAVDFGDKSVSPTHYTMKYGSSGNNVPPRNWLLQATNKPNAIQSKKLPTEDFDWVTLSAHVNDTSIDTDFGLKTWKLNLDKSKEGPFSIFRIIQTGKNKMPNNAEWGDTLVISGFELYGTLFSPPPPTIEKQCIFERDLDANGVTTLIGAKNIKVFSSSIWRGEAVDFISKDQVFVWTKNEPFSWFAIDLGVGNSVSPTHYTMKYGSSGNNVPPRNWLLQATNNPEALQSKKLPQNDPDWVTIKKHVGDTSIDTEFGAKTWKLDSLSPAQRGPFRIFRIIQTGKNKMPDNAEWGDTLVTSGFELYGTVHLAVITEEKRLIHTKEGDSGALDALGGIRSRDISVYSSSICRGEIRDFISKEKVFVWTKNEPNSWFAIDLGVGNSVLPTHYTMKYGSSGNNVCPRNWLLQASNKPNAIQSKKPDDPDWITLKEHTNDTSIDTEFGDATWSLDLPVERKLYYRFFRIIQTGKNKMSNNAEWGDTLVISGFELYGTLRKKVEQTKEKAQIKLESVPDDVEQKQFVYAKDLDKNGIIYNLGGIDSKIGVSASSIWRGTERDFISREKVFVWTKNEPFAWFAVDFGEAYSVLPTNYTLRYGSSGNNVPPRNWLLQATNKLEALKSKKNPNEDSDWVTLSTHINDQSINGEHATASWELTLPIEKQKFFRIFRIIQTGKNKMPDNAEWGDTLVTSGFEIYGFLRTKKSAIAESKLSKSGSIQKDFKFSYTLDTNGIIYALGGKESDISVLSSSISRGNARDFISREKAFVWTKNEPNSWFAVDFGESCSVLPTHYTMKYGSSGNNVPPRNWLLQATNTPEALQSTKPPTNDPDWITLKEHTNDTSIDAEFGAATWSLDLPSEKQKHYRIFRIIQTGKNKTPNNAEWGDTLVTSGFELYGNFKRVGSSKQIDDDAKSREFRYVRDLDTNGIIYALGPKVEVSSSSIWRGKVRDFISKKKVFVWTKNEPYSWFAVDLGVGNKVSPTNYTLRYGSSGNNVPPRNWVLQGTNKPEALQTKNANPLQDPDWTTICNHVNDTHIDTEFGSYTWSINLSQVKGLDKAWRIFRILQTGKNKMPDNAEWGDTLVTSGFEIYGTLIQELDVGRKEIKLDVTSTRINTVEHSIPFKEVEGDGIISFLKGVDNEKIGVFSSSIARGKVQDFISKDKVFVWTKNEPNAWFAVDFGEGKEIIPTHYTLRYGSSGNNVCPRNWLLQATNKVEVLTSSNKTVDPLEDKDWFTLSIHKEDSAIDTSHGSFNWQLNLPKEKQGPYRIFRIVQNGPSKMKDNANWKNVLVASGFELFGVLKERNEVQVSDKNFVYQSDLDTNGIIYALGPDRVKVKASSIRQGTSENAFISRSKVFCWTKNEPNAWFAVDLGKEITVVPTYYTLRYGSSGNNVCPRNWLLQATNDESVLEASVTNLKYDPLKDNKWVTLSVHVNDTNIDTDYATHSWPVKEVKQSFRIFRVIQNGPSKMKDNPDWVNVFVVCGFEIYGQLQQRIKVEFAEKQFSYQHDLDKNGIIYGLGGLSEGKLSVHASSCTQGKIEDFISREDISVWTSNEEYSWIAVDFKDKLVVPSHYTMRYGSSGNFCCPRNWLLQGSTKHEGLKPSPGVSPDKDPHWVTLREHINDTTLDTDFATHTWEIPVEKRKPFRLFRVIQTGPNKMSDNPDWVNVLVASGLEFYGTLQEKITSGDNQNIGKNQLIFRYSKSALGVIQGLNNEVSVYSSSQQQGNVRDFINRDKVFCWTKNEPFSWFAIDFGAKKTVIPTHYTLRYGSSGNNVCPRNWLLQATNKLDVIGTAALLHDPLNDPDWVTLKIHINDDTLNTDFAENTWALELSEDLLKPYRIFRVIQNGPSKMKDNPDWVNVFVVGGFELYGTVVLPETGNEYDDEEDEKIMGEMRAIENHQQSEGIIHYLGGAEKARVMVYSSGLKRGTERDFITVQSEQKRIICYTKNEKNAWFAVDFGEKKAINPIQYSFCYAENTTFTCPRNWLLQASNKPNAIRDGNDPQSKLWRTLKKHENDSTLDAEFAIGKWELELAEEYRKPYRFFRLIQYDENKSRGNEEYSNIFAACNFELWGTIMERVSAKDKVVSFSDILHKEGNEEAKIISKLELEEKPIRFPTVEPIHHFKVPDRVRCILIIQDLIYVASDHSSIFTFDLKTGGLGEKEFKGHSDGVTWITSKDDQLFSSSWDATIRVWDIDHALCIYTLEGHKNATTCVIALDDYIISSSDDRTIRFWDAKTFECKHTLEGHSARITHMAFSEDRLYSCSSDRSIKVWDKKNFKLIETFLSHKDTIRFLACEKGRIISASDDGTIAIKNSVTGKEVQTFSREQTAGQVPPSCFALHGDFIYSISPHSKQIFVWDRRVGSLTSQIDGSESNLTWISVGKDDELFTGGEDGTVKVWAKKTLYGIKTIRGHKDQVNCIFIDDQTIISGSSDNTLRLWNANTGENISVLKSTLMSPISCIFVMDDRIYTGSPDKRIRYWSIKDKECQQVFKAHDRGITDIWGRDDELFTAGLDGILKLWDASLCKLIKKYPSGKKEIRCFKVLDNFIFVGAENEIQIVSLASGDNEWTCISKIECKEEIISCLQVLRHLNMDNDSIEYQIYVGAGKDIFQYLYRKEFNKENNKEEYKLEQLENIFRFHTENVTSIALYEGVLFSCAKDRHVAVWDTSTGKLTYRLVAHEDDVLQMTIVDQKLYTCSSDQTILVWDLQLLMARSFFLSAASLEYLEFNDHDAPDLRIPDSHQRNILMFIASFGSTQCLTYLIKEFQFDMKECNIHGESALYFAIKNSRWQLLKELSREINSEFDVNDDSKIMDLLKKKARSDDLVFFQGLSKVHSIKFSIVDILSHCFRAQTPSLKILEHYLNTNDIDVNARGELDRTLLHNACYFGCPSAVELLLKHNKIHVNVEDADNKTPLHLAHEEDDLLIGKRGIQSSHELLLNRMECIRLILSTGEASKTPNLLGLKDKNNKNVYETTLLHQYSIRRQLKLERRELSNAREIRESRELFEKICEITDASNEYPPVIRHRKNFAAKYFLLTIIPYLIWIILLIIIGVGRTTNNNSVTYFFDQSLTNTFVTPFAPTDFNSFWAFVEGPFYEGLLMQGGSEYMPSSTPFYVSGHRLIGAVQLLQVREKPNSCEIPSQFAGDIENCYNVQFVEDTAPFNNYSYTINARDTFLGSINTYPGNGFVEILPPTTDLLNKTAQLQTNFLSNQTRALALTFTIYNVNLNAFGVVTLVLEFPASGQVVPSSSVSVVKVLTDSRPTDLALTVLEIIAVVYFLYAFVFTELWEIFSKKRKITYLYDIWNYYEWIVIIIGAIIISFHIKILVLVNALDFNPPMTSYVDFSVIENSFNLEYNLFSIFLLLALLRALKFLRIPPYTGPATLSILDTMQDQSFIVFVIVFAYVIISYGFAYHICFGVDIYSMRNMLEGIISILRLLFGDYSFDNMQQSSAVFGPLYFFLAVTLISIVLMNMFIAVISDIYIALQQHNEEVWNIYVTSLMVKDIKIKDSPLFRHRVERAISRFFYFIGKSIVKVFTSCCRTNQSNTQDLTDIEMSPAKELNVVEILDTISSPEEVVRNLDDEYDLSISLSSAEIDQLILDLRTQRSNTNNKGLLQAIRSDIHTEVTKSARDIMKSSSDQNLSLEEQYFELHSKIQSLTSKVQDMSMSFKNEIKIHLLEQKKLLKELLNKEEASENEEEEEEE